MQLQFLKPQRIGFIKLADLMFLTGKDNYQALVSQIALIHGDNIGSYNLTKMDDYEERSSFYTSFQDQLKPAPIYDFKISFHGSLEELQQSLFNDYSHIISSSCVYSWDNQVPCLIIPHFLEINPETSKLRKPHIHIVYQAEDPDNLRKYLQDDLLSEKNRMEQGNKNG